MLSRKSVPNIQSIWNDGQNYTLRGIVIRTIHHVLLRQYQNQRGLGLSATIRMQTKNPYPPKFTRLVMVPRGACSESRTGHRYPDWGFTSTTSVLSVYSMKLSQIKQLGCSSTSFPIPYLPNIAPFGFM